jgi:hypothetical protein
MLVVKNEIITLKLLSGEEVIAKLVETKETSYILAKPVILAPSPNQPGGIVAAPFTISVDKDASVEILKSAVMALSKTTKSFAAQYTEITTGLKIPGGPETSPANINGSIITGNTR